MSLQTFIYLPKPQDGRWSKIVLLQKDGISCHFSYFQSISSPNPRQTYFSYIFLPQISLFHGFSLRPHPPLIQKGGGHTLHAYSFSYWDTPTSGPKGGGHVPEMPSPPRSNPPMLITYPELEINFLQLVAKTDRERKQVIFLFLMKLHCPIM